MARYVEPVPPSSTPPAPLIVTIYGLYGRSVDTPGTPALPTGTADSAPRPAAHAGDWLPISALVRLLAELDVDEPSARSAISRLKRRGLLVADRRGGVAGYGLSPEAGAILDEGDARIFSPAEPSLADGWVLAVFSVPESERAQRHTLRTQLSALGFGAAAAGVWVAPAHRYELTAAALRRHRLDGYVDLFRAEYLAFGDIGELARKWWDLGALRAAYTEFMHCHDAAAAEAVTPARAFAAWVRALTAFRRLPYRDPGLPVELLPADWPAPAARELFATLRETLGGPAGDFVAGVLG